MRRRHLWRCRLRLRVRRIGRGRETCLLFVGVLDGVGEEKDVDCGCVWGCADTVGGKVIVDCGRCSGAAREGLTRGLGNELRSRSRS